MPSDDPAATGATGDAAQLLGRMRMIEEAGRLRSYLALDATFTTISIVCCRVGRNWGTDGRRGGGEASNSPIR